MPLYEYQCQSCSKVTEALQKMSDAPLTLCESCGGPLKRLISAPAVQFKGTGWYVTDYARKGGGGEKGKSGGQAEDGGAKGEKGDKGEKSEKAADAGSAKTEAPAAPAAKPESAP